MLRVAQASVPGTCAWLAAFYALNILFVLLIPGDTLNGSIYYLPSLCMLVLLGYYDRRIFLAAALFTFALIFRSIDRAVCPVFPLGTHFLWHLFISLSVYYTTASLLKPSENA